MMYLLIDLSFIIFKIVENILLDYLSKYIEKKLLKVGLVDKLIIYIYL